MSEHEHMFIIVFCIILKNMKCTLCRFSHLMQQCTRWRSLFFHNDRLRVVSDMPKVIGYVQLKPGNLSRA